MARRTTRRGALRSLGSATFLGSVMGTLSEDSQSVTGHVRITEPGRYHLTEDIDCLEIVADRVRVDGRRHTVRGLTTILGSSVSITNLAMGDGVRILDARHVSIDDSRIDVRLVRQPEADTLLSIENSRQCVVTDTVLHSTNRTGVELTNSEKNTFRSCTMTSSVVVSLTNSHKNRFVDCELLSEDRVVVLTNSDLNRFKSNVLDSDAPAFTLVNSELNRFVENEIDILVAGFVLRRSGRNLVLKNVVDGDLGARGAILEDSDRNRIERNDFCALLVPPPFEPLVVVSPDSTGNVIRNVECEANTKSETPPSHPQSDDKHCTLPEE
ncbi:hypothetical protein BM92_06870 [Haloferax mediterranei ATCC 33500]|nr:hypothetical protein BM92_06870 [Haloferax mediterranei ATCC 33500]